MPKKPAIEDTLPDPARGKAGSVYVPVPHRVQRALDLLRPRRKRGQYRPGYSYTETKSRLMREFDIGETAAEGDLAKAYEVMRHEIAKTDYGTVVRAEMEQLARQAADRGGKGDYAVARQAWTMLGKWSGLEGEDDSTISKITDAALDAAIRQNVRSELLGMSDEEFAALVAERAARSAK